MFAVRDEVSSIAMNCLQLDERYLFIHLNSERMHVPTKQKLQADRALKEGEYNRAPGCNAACKIAQTDGFMTDSAGSWSAPAANLALTVQKG